jgi:hypothetical protein
MAMSGYFNDGLFAFCCILFGFPVPRGVKKGANRLEVIAIQGY